MSFWDTAKRALVGRDYDDYEDYDDEYYEDEEHEDEKPKRTFFSFLSRSKNDDYENDYDEQPAVSKYSSTRSSYSSSSYKDSSTNAIKRQIAKVLPKNLEGVEMSIISPTSFDDSSRIVKEVKSGKITVFDMSGINNVDEARRIVDYVCGAAEGMDCPFSRICPSVFCIAPEGVVFNGTRTRY